MEVQGCSWRYGPIEGGKIDVQSIIMQVMEKTDQFDSTYIVTSRLSTYHAKDSIHPSM